MGGFAVGLIGGSIVFAKEDIPSNTLLGHYAGAYVIYEDCGSSEYIFNLNGMDLMCLNALNKGNWERFMNHAECEKENLRSTFYITEKGPYIVFFRRRTASKTGSNCSIPMERVTG